MDTDLVGRVERLELRPKAEVLWPLFEALANSLESIIHNQVRDGKITIEIVRERSLQLTLPGDINTVEEQRRVLDISVADNGVGFNQENLTSFSKLDSRFKQHLGCKGVGRLYWLKAFGSAKIESTFEEDGRLLTRKFELSLPNGVKNASTSEVDEQSNLVTKVTLCGYSDRYEKHFRGKRLTTIKQEIVKHFLPTFLLAHCPSIRIIDGPHEATIDSDDLPVAEKKTFVLRGHKFTLYNIKAAQSENSSHTLHICAGNRVVESKKLESLIKFTKKKLSASQGRFYYIGYLTSEYLDSRVNNERNGILYDEDEDVPLGEGLGIVTEKLLDATVSEKIKTFLKDQIEELAKSREAAIDQILTIDLPALAYIRTRNKTELESIPADASIEDIKKSIALIHYENHVSTKKHAQELLDSLDTKDRVGLVDFEQQLQEEFADLNEVHQADLAQYVLYRRWILDVLKKVIGRRDSASFFREDTVHNILFPMREDDKDCETHSSHNLWLIDDRLAFYDYLASDLELNKHKVAGVNSKDRPDLCCYFFSDNVDAAKQDSIVIIEFKRPGREDYAKGDDPFKQVLDYVQQLSAGSRDFDGRQIQVTDSTRYYCYVVCDTLNEEIKKAAYYMQLLPTTDGSGYFKNFNDTTYIEVIPFSKLLGDAIKRNEIFFRKLGLSMRGR